MNMFLYTMGKGAEDVLATLKLIGADLANYDKSRERLKSILSLAQMSPLKEQSLIVASTRQTKWWRHSSQNYTN